MGLILSPGYLTFLDICATYCTCKVHLYIYVCNCGCYPLFLVPSIQANAQQILVLDGDEVNLRCTPSSPDISITWLFNGAIISDGGRISLSPFNLNHMLTISSSTVSDNGVYKCQFVTTVFQLIISREISLTVNEGT